MLLSVWTNLNSRGHLFWRGEGTLCHPAFFRGKCRKEVTWCTPRLSLECLVGDPTLSLYLVKFWKCIDISHMGTEGIFIINTSNFLNFPSFSCYIIRWHLRLWPPAYHMTRWYLLSCNLMKFNLLEVEGMGLALWVSGEEDIKVSSRSHGIENVNIIIST